MSGRWNRRACVPVFSSQALIGQPLVGYASERENETARVVQSLAIVESETLLVQVSEQVERLDRNIGSVNAALQQTPKVFHIVRMNVALDIRNRMVNNLMSVVTRQPAIGKQRIGVESRTRFNMLSDFRLKRFTFPARD